MLLLCLLSLVFAFPRRQEDEDEEDDDEDDDDDEEDDDDDDDEEEICFAIMVLSYSYSQLFGCSSFFSFLFQQQSKTKKKMNPPTGKRISKNQWRKRRSERTIGGKDI